MLIEDIMACEFTEENFIKDYRKTAAILDEETLRSLKRMEEIESRK